MLALAAAGFALWRALPRSTWFVANHAAAPALRYVGRQACAECHAREDSLWRGSHHDLAMQPATRATVLGDFRSTRFTHFGVTSTFTASDGKYRVRTDGPDGALHDYEIAYTFGISPLQQYLIAFPGGRYQALNVAWDTRPATQGGQRWFHLYPKEAVPHGDILHWTGPYQNWNFMCAECHSTNVVKGYDAAADTYHTTFAEVNVSCEACHGPGSAHVEWGRAVARGQANRSGRDDGLIVKLSDTTPVTWIVDTATGLAHRSPPRTSHAEVEMCAHCHSRRSVLTDRYRAGLLLADTHRPAVFDDPLYYADGQIQGEVYEYGSFRQSRMYRHGVTCSDCHDPHRAALTAPVDAVCARCHTPSKFAVASHTHHRPASTGSSCVGCHMPTHTYMVVHQRHDHSIRVPRPDLSVALGTPNACTTCHTNQTSVWAATASTAWWPGLAQRPHYGQALELGRRGARGAGPALIALAADTTAPAMARATAVEMVANQPSPAALGAMQAALWNDDPLVRAAGVSSTYALPPDDRVPMLAPLLTDSVRLLRIDAARALAASTPGLLTPEQRVAFGAAITEYREEQSVNADRAEARLNLGAYFAETRQLDSAAHEYAVAQRMNPSLLGTYVNLADLYRQEGRDSAAEAILRDGLKGAPKGAGADLDYALGLTMVREKRYSDAIAPLSKAATLAPDEPRYALAYALVLQQTGRLAQARSVIEGALAKHPDDRDLASAYVSLAKPSAAP
jgi:Flp pilus assembly protein TadD